MARPSNLLLAGGYVAVALAIVFARRSPATGYEPSIYAATPTATWIGVGIGLAVALVTAVGSRGPHQAVGITLGATAITTVIALPVIRGYRFLGKGDGLTHLGWVRDFLQGGMEPYELLYPGLHSVASMTAQVAGFEAEHALLVAVVVLFLPFVLFVPLAVKSVTASPMAIGFAAIVAWFVLPINNIATHTGAHSNSNALFFVPVVVFALFAYMQRRGRTGILGTEISPFGFLIVLCGFGLLLIHPQQMVNVVVILGAISLVQYHVRSRYDDHPALDHPTMYVYTVVLGAMFVVWVAANERFRDATAGLVYGLLTADIGGGQEVDQREASLAEIGGSLPELFVKLFLVSAVLATIVACYLFVIWSGASRTPRRSRIFASYLGVSLFPLGGMFAVYFLGTPTMAFRQIGFIMVIVTILAGVALAAFVGRASPTLSPGVTSSVVAVGLAACLVLAALTVFGSPFIYNPTQHVSEQTYQGYETAITNGTEDNPYAGYGYTTYRYNDAIYGVESMTENQSALMWPGEGVIDMEEFNDRAYSDAYPGDGSYFLLVSEFDTVREHHIYRGLNLQEEPLDDLADHPSSAVYVTNEEFTMDEIRELRSEDDEETPLAVGE